MTIRKIGHSCLLFEKDGKRLLLDPGSYAFLENEITPDQIGVVDVILVTHDHSDHCDPQYFAPLMGPDTRILGNSGVIKKLHGVGIEASVFEEGSIAVAGFSFEALATAHGQMPNACLHHCAYRIDKRVVVTGDSFDPALDVWGSCDILTLPVTAPWLRDVDVYAFLLSLSPKAVIPVHDGFVKDFYKESRYERLKLFLIERNSVLHSLRSFKEIVEV